ncbi:MAG TPA: Hsp70 family protein [Mycobacterium sp.]|nr:Hsp70 family protein [Mycobacterium sp.]
MSDGVGLSVGASNLAAVVVGRTAVTRSPVVTLYPHRPPEVGVPSENPNLNERGLIITDFVDRVGDPTGIVAADGSTHMADKVLADALLAMLYTVGSPPPGPAAVTYPAHWRPAAVDVLRNALASVPEFQQPTPASLVPDSAAALAALQEDPGVPTRGVIALCDFGGTGTNVTLLDAANGFAPIGPTVRHTELSGDLIDQALLTHVINALSAAGTIDLSGTSAIGSLTRLRGQCRGAKERLSTAAVTSLVAELPGHRSDVRLTRNELDEAIRAPLAEFVGTLQKTLERNGICTGNLVAAASIGGGARIPAITTTLSEHFRVPVITTGRPELTAAIGGGLKAGRGTADDGQTLMALAPDVAAAAAAVTAMSPEAGPQDASDSSTFRALAWSDADDVPDVAPTDMYEYDAPANGGGYSADARPQMQLDHELYEAEAAPLPWYRKPTLILVAGMLALLAALTAAMLFVMRDETTPTPASITAPPQTPSAPPPATTAAPNPATQAPPPQTQTAETRTVTQQAPPPVTVTEAPPPLETSEAPPPPITTEALPPSTQPPPFTIPPTATTEPPPFTIPPITLFPGGPTIPIGPQPQPPQPAP